MEVEEMKELRERVRRLKLEEEKVEQLKSWRSRITGMVSGVVQSKGYVKSQIEELTVEIVDREVWIEEEKCEVRCRQASLMAAISREVEGLNERAILTERYCFATSFRMIARTLHLSESQIFFLHRRALKKIKNSSTTVAKE